MYEQLYYELKYEGLSGIAKKTGCMKPCFYKKYEIMDEGDSSRPSFAGFWVVSNDTFVESEVLILPMVYLESLSAPTSTPTPTPTPTSFCTYIYSYS